MYHALGWHFVHQYALAGNLYYLTQPQSFSNRAVQSHALRPDVPRRASFRGASSSLGGAVDTIRRWRARVRDSAGRNSAVGLGRRGVHLLQHRALQSRSLCVSRRAGLLPACGTRVDERQRHPAGSRAGARQHLCPLVVAILGVVLVVVGAFGGLFRCSTSGLDLPLAALLISRSASPLGGGALTVTHLPATAVSPVLCWRSRR